MARDEVKVEEVSLILVLLLLFGEFMYNIATCLGLLFLMSVD
jgi:hypothetical protein